MGQRDDGEGHGLGFSHRGDLINKERLSKDGGFERCLILPRRESSLNEMGFVDDAGSGDNDPVAECIIECFEGF